MRSDEPAGDADGGGPARAYREVKYRHSRDFAGLIDRLGVSLLISTYQAGQLVTVGTDSAGLAIGLNHFEQAMGIALSPRRMAVGSRGVIWLLQNSAELAARLPPAGRYDACYLARQSFITGNIHGHEMAWVGEDLWVVNTLFSCLCTLHEDFSFVPRWQPPFITQLEANDRCHLNGLALADGRPKYVTVMAESNAPGGWRPGKASSGRILDIASGEAVAVGLSMPHSPRVYRGKLWVLNSGSGSLEAVDPRSGKRDVVALMPGYTRGLSFHGKYAFVGLSRIRETAVFGGVPIAEYREKLRCGVAVVDLDAGESVAYLEFETGVEEIFAVEVLATARCVSVTGPYPAQDDAKDVWIVPPPGTVPSPGMIPRRSEAGRPAAALPISTSDVPTAVTGEDLATIVRSGLALHGQGRFAEAVETLRRAVALRPMSAELHNHLGNALQDFGRQDLAIESYQHALQVEGTFAPAHQNLGYLLVNLGRLDEGLSHLQRAQQLQPSALNRVMLATSLPVVYESVEDLRRRRRAMEEKIGHLVEEGNPFDTTNSIVPTNFFAAYQGFNDRDLQRSLSRLYQGPNLVRERPRKNSDGRIRVGFLSAHFHDHTIGRLNLGRVLLLDRQQFEVTVVSVGHHRDGMAQRFQQGADHHVELSGGVQASREQVADLDLDVLLFADVGMDSLTYTLALSRMAPVQCVTWGHPVTTGNPTIDYFLSSKLLETEGAEAHYTEQLISLVNLGTYYYRPKRSGATRSRESFGLDAQRHLYLCPQTLFKIHPEFDAILADILRRDPLGEIVFIAGRQPEWTRLLRNRFTRTLGNDSARVRFLPPLSNPDFLELNAVADVLLDSIHFGGGNTSYEALALGTPIVTLPGSYLRSRITRALYHKMGYIDCVAGSPDEYVRRAVRLGTDADHRQAVSERIQSASEALFEDAEEVREFERGLKAAFHGKS